MAPQIWHNLVVDEDGAQYTILIHRSALYNNSRYSGKPVTTGGENGIRGVKGPISKVLRQESSVQQHVHSAAVHHPGDDVLANKSNSRLSPQGHADGAGCQSEHPQGVHGRTGSSSAGDSRRKYIREGAPKKTRAVKS